MNTPQTPQQRQQKSRQKQKAAGATRMTLSLNASTAQILRSLAVEHQVTQAKVIEMGVQLAKRALLEFAAGEEPAKAVAAPAVPPEAPSGPDDLEDLEEDGPAPMRPAEARAIRLGLANLQVQP